MKNRYLKLICILLVSALLMNMLPMSIFAEEYRENLSAAPETSTEEVDISNARIVEEIVDKRTEYSKEFLLSNGLYMAAVYADAVHYEKDSGWAEIDNTLTAKADGTYTNTAGVWNVSFPQTLTGAKSVTIEKDGYSLSFAMSGELRSTGEIMSTRAVAAPEQFSVAVMQQSAATVAQTDRDELAKAYKYPEIAPEKLHARLTYANVYQNTDITYDLDANTVKESIILNAYSRTLRGYRYTLNVGDMVPILEEDGQITFYDAKRENVVMVMPAPYLMDAAKEYNEDIQVQLTGSGSTYTLTYLLPREWLASQERAWPVILDPVVTASLVRTNIRDCTVASKKTYSNNWSLNSIGYGSIAGIMRTYLKYRELPALQSSDVVVGATISMYQADNPLTVTPVEVHKVNNTWESETITWANMPSHNTTVEDYALVDSYGQYNWIITDIVREWYANENTGMVFKASDAIETGGAQNFKQFHSADYGNEGSRPLLAIYFRNNNGLEDYWDYTASFAGRAGTGYINNFTGNLVWVRDDLGFGGNRMPVAIKHIYNANDYSINSFGMGNGWRTNYNQLVYQWGVDSSYYVWEDADGTYHYFKHDSGNTYKDEDGLELTLTTNGSGTEKYCITDKNGNKSCFDTEGRLTKIQNNQDDQSYITISYNGTSKQISIITDGAGRNYYFDYPNGLLTCINYKGTGSSEISYLTIGYSGTKLASVTDKDGKASAYTYNTNGLLETVTDNDGYKLEYTYHTLIAATWQPYRVKSVVETDINAIGNTVNRGSLSFDYAHNQTTIADYYGNVEIHQFNDFGNTISIQDDEGHATYTQYARNTDNDSGKKNQLTLSSKLQNTVANLLTDSSFENNEVWGVYPAGTSCTNVSTESYLGSRSLLFTATAWSSISSGYFNIEPSATYTFSAYVKGVSGDSILMIVNRDDMSSQQTIATSGATEWQRVEVSYTNTGSTNISACAYVFGTAGTQVYVDCVQVERAESASRYNLMENGDFRYSGSPALSWTAYGFSSGDSLTPLSSSAAPSLDNTVLKINGNPQGYKQLVQGIPISGDVGDTYVLSGWAKGNSVPSYDVDGNEREFKLVVALHNQDGTKTYGMANFNPDSDDWQYAATAVVAEKPYNSMAVVIRYNHNANTAWFDGIQLYKEEFGSSYTYDDKGNVKSVTDLQKQTTTYEYDTSSNLTKVIQNNQAKMTYTYDNWHNVKTATTQEGLVYNFTYDTYGNNTSVSITSGGSTMTSTATYSADGNRLESTTDALGNVTRYNYLEDTNELEWVEYPRDTEYTQTYYSYDNMYRMTMAECETDMGNSLSAAYTYTDDCLTKIQTPSTTYNFTYAEFDLRTRVRVGNRTLVSYNYTEEAVNDRKYDLDGLDYGNGDKVKYEYDKKGRVTKETFMEGDTEKGTVTYAYDNDGALAKVTDSATGITTSYYYDLTDRMMKYVESGNGYSHSVGYEYDTLNNLTKQVESINGTDHTTTYTYDDDNRIESVTNGAVSEHYTYDGLGRAYQQTTKHNGTNVVTKTAAFQSSASGKTSAQVATYTIDAAGYDVTYTYTYDDNGNITSISDGTNTTSYVYDSANQLIRENNQAGGFTYTWTYDNAGNILNRKEYAYTTGTLGTPTDTVTYTYGDSQWGDLLTAYDGTAITSDNIGNTLTDGTWSYTWEHGRQLASMSNGTTTWTYTYNADGLRTKRTNGTDTYSYIYNGSQLTQMTKGTDTLYFAYDAGGAPLSVTYNGTIYYYVTNLQGDVIAILNSAGTAVTTYTYDAWGNPLYITGSMASTLGTLNPLRYRGYVYDTETELYYLQSRYYDPCIGRFINADAFAATGQGFVGNNMFAYCGNNPVLLKDSLGTRHEISAGGAGYRDVTEEIYSSLREECRRIKAFQATAKSVAVMSAPTNAVKQSAIMLVSSGVDFYLKVDHEKPWDIKRPKVWEETIGTRFPPGGHTVLYDGILMTPEMLGNFTYGYLGYHYGFSLPILYAGSYYAADFPTEGESLDNELWDWEWITKGYSYALLNG